MEWEDLIKKFKQIYNDDKNLIFLSVPGRVNLLGMHVDHRGGSVNPIATREMKIIVQKRIDDTVQVFNSDERFAEQKFLISEEIPDKVEWNQWINNIKIEKGNWVNYIKAGVLYFKNKFFENKISGMNLLIDSDIPMAGGLSSSTALNMGASFAFLKVNDISLPDEEFIDSCGEAEWYVGTRGGKGDQAAIVLSKRGNISHISFSPLKIEHLPFPEDYCVAICNTFKEAKKSEGAKNIFNERVATYEISLFLVKEQFPSLYSIKMLRDINTKNFELSYIYKILKTLPLRISRKELNKKLSSRKKELEIIYKTHEELKEGYRVRGVFLFGIAESERSRICADFLRKGEMEKFGELMNISHNGDRLKELELEDNSPLYQQPGGYAVSCEEADRIVDLALKTPGVLGARLVGGGLGGYVAVLLKKEDTEGLKKVLKENYYAPKNLPLGVEICFPQDGLRQLTF